MKIEQKDYKIFTFSLIALFILFCITEFYGTNNINSIFSKREFNFKGYVYAFPNREHDKNYRLKADMYKEGHSYFVKKIYFYNGGFIEFEDYGEPLDKKGSMACGYLEYVDEETNKDWCFRFYGEQFSEPIPSIKRE